MIVDWLLLLLGAGLLYFGAARLVEGAASVARRLRVPPLVVALTVMSAATCAPELALSLLAATQGQSALVLGTVIGSNVANTGLVFGLVALVARPQVDPALFKRDVPFLLVATLAAGPILLNGQIDRYEGLAFFLGAVVFTLSRFRSAKTHAEASTTAGTGELLPNGSNAATTTASQRAQPMPGFLLGLGGLISGGLAFTWGVTGLAQGLELSQRLTGLTLVAFGTAMPELAVALVAAKRGHPDVALGNLVGGTLFNVLVVFGLTSLIAPTQGRLVEVRPELIAMTLLTFSMAGSLRKARQVTRREGLCYLLGYAGFLAALFYCY